VIFVIGDAADGYGHPRSKHPVAAVGRKAGPLVRLGQAV